MKALEQNFEKERKENFVISKLSKLKNKVLKGKLWNFKNRSQQHILRFDGMVEYENESWADNKENVEDLLYQRLIIQRVRTEWAHITGKPKDDGPRTILAKFRSFFMIFKNFWFVAFLSVFCVSLG